MAFPPKMGAMQPPTTMGGGGGNPFAKKTAGPPAGKRPSGKGRSSKKFSKGGRSTARRSR